MHKPRILILYTDPAGLALLTSMLNSLGLPIEEAANDRAAVQLMERRDIDLVLALVEPSDADALELLTYVRRKHREVPVILLFPRAHPDRAKEALRQGAMAVLKYPVPAVELRSAVLQALDQSGGRPARDPVGGSSGPAPASPADSKPAAVPPTASVGLPPTPAVRGGSPATAVVVSGLNPTPGANRSPALAQATPTSAPVPAACPALPAMQRLEQFAREIGLIGHDPTWRRVIDLAGTLAATRAPVLILGEPGTGKSLVARLIHSLGSHPDRPFVTVEASAMAHEFAIRETAESPSCAPAAPPPDWSDKLSQARGGTLYLDEVSGLPTELQLHLLRELQARDFAATAAQAAAPGDMRCVMSTSESLPALVEQGRFHQGLYRRINVVRLMLPPLRHRGMDIELLAESFRARHAHEFSKAVTGFTRDALDILQRHDWPGNVRELEAAVQRAVALCTGPRITSSQLAPIIDHHRQARADVGTPPPDRQMKIHPLKEALEEPEKRIIILALQAFNWNRSETARVLNINRTTLYKKMKKYRLIFDNIMYVN
jgi:two-component system, NtrC family, response regulator HydG